MPKFINWNRSIRSQSGGLVRQQVAEPVNQVSRGNQPLPWPSINNATTDATTPEGQKAVVGLTLSSPAVQDSIIFVNNTAAGTATFGVDYSATWEYSTDGVNYTSYTQVDGVQFPIPIPAGATLLNIRIQLLTDVVTDVNETIIVIYNPGQGIAGANNQSQVTITDVAPAPTRQGLESGGATAVNTGAKVVSGQGLETGGATAINAGGKAVTYKALETGGATARNTSTQVAAATHKIFESGGATAVNVSAKTVSRQGLESGGATDANTTQKTIIYRAVESGGATDRNAGLKVVSYQALESGGGTSNHTSTRVISFTHKAFESGGASANNVSQKTLMLRALDAGGAGDANTTSKTIAYKALETGGASEVAGSSRIQSVTHGALESGGITSSNTSLNIVREAGGDGGKSGSHSGAQGGTLIKHRLMQAFASEQERKSAQKQLKPIADMQRTAIRSAANNLAKQAEFDLADVESRLSDVMRAINVSPAEAHVDWILYYLRIAAFRIEQELLEEEEALIAMLI